MFQVKAFALVLAIAAAQGVAPPEVSEKLKVSPGEKVFLHAHAKGVQIYACQAGEDKKYAWVLKAPKAELFDEQGKLIGDHFAGPTWKLKDGSEVTGKAIGKQDAPKSGAIPWLLVNVTGHQGKGALDHATTIQRVNTEGGAPPAADSCDETKGGIERQSAYSADYFFYAPQQ